MLGNRRPNLPIVAYCAAACAILIVVYHVAFRDALSALRAAGQVSVVQSHDRLLSQLEAFRELANFLSRHPDIIDAGRGLGVAEQLNELLLRHALASGAGDIYMLDHTGTVIFSSNYEDPTSFIGLDFSDRPDVISAMTGRLGVYHGIEPADQTRDFFYTRGVVAIGKVANAFVVVKVDASSLEFNWRIDDKILAFVDEDGVAFLANRADLLMRGDPEQPNRYPANAVKEGYPHEQHMLGDYLVWRFDAGLGLPREALVIEREVLQLDMTARLFLDTSDARDRAKLQTALAAAMMIIFGLYILFVTQRRRQISEKLRIEEAANANLEERVTRRTQQLERAQSELIHASKLTALGQMSAGISHELNQPLSTIQNYAENSKKLLDRDRADDAKNNLSRISEQATRMGRIIQNLRAFARKENEPLEPVDMAEVIAASIALAQQPLADAGISVERTGDTGPAIVRAGKVRLQQVVVNLLSNAIDALSAQPIRRITVELHANDTVHVIVRDTGPGLSEPERVFEPFYTTKDIGTSKGLGLGLSISYGIIGSFGGSLSAHNSEMGGAVFTITMPKHNPEAAE